MTQSRYQKLAAVTVGAVLFGLGTISAKSAQASIFAAPFDASFSSQSLGPIALDTGGSIPSPYGGLTFLDTDTLLIGGLANDPAAAIYSVDLIRDSSTNRITGYAGAATFFANAPGISTGGIDGGLTVAPNGTVLYTTYGDNSIGQILPGTTSPTSFIDLTPLGVQASTGGLNFVPEGLPGAGRLKITSYDTDNFYDAPVSYNPDGTISLGALTEINLGLEEGSRGLEGIAYVGSSSGFDKPTVLLSEFNSPGIAAFEIDALGNPILETEQDFITGFPRTGGGTEGLVVDPVTGDILVSVYGDAPASQVLLITPEAPEPTTPNTNPFVPNTSIDLSSGSGMSSGAVSTGSEIFSFEASAGELLTLDVDVTDILPGPAYTNDDTVLYLYNSAGEILAVGDDKAESLDSSIVNYLIPKKDTYYAAVTSGGNEPIVELGRPFNTLLGFEENGLGNVEFDFSINSMPVPESARLFNIAFAESPNSPFGSFLVDGDQVLFLDLNGSRNTDVTGPMTIFVNPDDNTLSFDNFDFVLQFPEPFPSTDINEIFDALGSGVVTAIVPPDLLIEEIVFSEAEVIPEPITIIGTGTAAAFGAFFKKQRSKKSKK